jgi:hypothetical protein
MPFKDVGNMKKDENVKMKKNRNRIDSIKEKMRNDVFSIDIWDQG